MKNYKTIGWLLLFVLIANQSCYYDFEYPDDISSEIKISCHLTDLDSVIVEDTDTLPNIWVTTVITNGFVDIQFDFFGQCWSYNTDSLPTIKPSNDVFTLEDILGEHSNIEIVNGEGMNNRPLRTEISQVRSFRTWRSLHHIGWIYNWQVQSGIPISSDDTKLIVRGFVIFKKRYIVYSEPLILDNPIQYAN